VFVGGVREDADDDVIRNYFEQVTQSGQKNSATRWISEIGSKNLENLKNLKKSRDKTIILYDLSGSEVNFPYKRTLHFCDIFYSSSETWCP
jgi:hypothetical protein